MATDMSGTVIEKSFQPVPGAPPKYWCYLMIETTGGQRVSIRMHHRQVDKVTIGDRIAFRKPALKNKVVKVSIIG